MKIPLLTLFFCCFEFGLAAQPVIGRQLVDQYPTSNNTKTFGLTWLPDDYNSTSTSYPLIIFLHAAGEVGDGVHGLYNLLNVGLPRKIAEGWNPEAVNPADGKDYKFIVVSPQASTRSGWSYSYQHVKYILPNVISRYRVDTKRIYIVGISAGGAGTWSSVTNDSNFTKKIAAILPVSSVGVNNPYIEYPNIKYISGAYGVKVWTVCGKRDSWYYTALKYVSIINSVTPAPQVPATLTGIDGYGHDTALWKMVFDTSWRNNSFQLNFYEWMLQYQRDDTSSPNSNKPPVTNAGNNQTIMLPTSKVILSGSAADTDGSITSYQWTKISGPSNVNITSPDDSETTVENLIQGVYQFELKATDNDGATTADTVTVTVLPAANQPPVADAGKNQRIILPTNYLLLTGSATDTDGTIKFYHWTKVYGPDQFHIISPWGLNTWVTNLSNGVYWFELKVIDNHGAVATDTVTIRVARNSNASPIVNAGEDQVIKLPDNVLLSGSAEDTDGTVESYHWSKIDGPDQFNIVSPDQPKTWITGLVKGVYQFELSAMDDEGAVAADTVMITVLPASGQNVPPVANAGDDQEITLPLNTISLSGSAKDADGNIESYLWEKVAGPSQFTISNSNIAAPVLSNLVTGVYTFRFTVIDDAGADDTDDVSIVVNPSPTGYTAIPAKIEAENYNDKSGVYTEYTSDIGGGRDVGWIDDGDWMDYNIYVDSSGAYTVNFRVATERSGSNLQLLTGDGGILANLDIPNTGSFQGWVTKTVVVYLSQGYQTLRVLAGGPVWNLNWMQFVRGVPVAKSIPAKIEAEDYDAMSGIQMEPTYDAGDGLDVGWIDPGDWMDYNVNATTAGEYTVNLRVATPNWGSKLQIQQSDGTVLANVNVPTTGSYQSWTTVSTNITLDKGEQTLRIISTGYPYSYWNINWIEFKQGAGLIAQHTESLAQANSLDVSYQKQSSFEIHPNPVQDKIILQVNSANKGMMTVQVTDMQGAIRKEYRLMKDIKGVQLFNLSSNGFAPGTYVVRVQLEKWKASKLILKL